MYAEGQLLAVSGSFRMWTRSGSKNVCFRPSADIQSVSRFANIDNETLLLYFVAITILYESISGLYYYDKETDTGLFNNC
jgi:hypothetical protein